MISAEASHMYNDLLKVCYIYDQPLSANKINSYYWFYSHLIRAPRNSIDISYQNPAIYQSIQILTRNFYQHRKYKGNGKPVKQNSIWVGSDRNQSKFLTSSFNPHPNCAPGRRAKQRRSGWSPQKSQLNPEL
jgi:hypothetical protein